MLTGPERAPGRGGFGRSGRGRHSPPFHAMTPARNRSPVPVPAQLDPVPSGAGARPAPVAVTDPDRPLFRARSRPSSEPAAGAGKPPGPAAGAGRRCPARSGRDHRPGSAAGWAVADAGPGRRGASLQHPHRLAQLPHHAQHPPQPPLPAPVPVRRLPGAERCRRRGRSEDFRAC